LFFKLIVIVAAPPLYIAPFTEIETRHAFMMKVLYFVYYYFSDNCCCWWWN